jgi:hypothetical protein
MVAFFWPAASAFPAKPVRHLSNEASPEGVNAMLLVSVDGCVPEPGLGRGVEEAVGFGADPALAAGLLDWQAESTRVARTPASTAARRRLSGIVLNQPKVRVAVISCPHTACEK